MSKTVLLERLPQQVGEHLRSVWEEHESVVLKRNGEPVAAVVPMEDFRRLHPETERAKGKGRRAAKGEGRRLALSEAEGARGERQGAPSLAYELPADLLAAYHRLVDKKFSEGLTPEEEAEFERVGKALDEADMQTPLGQAILQKAEEEHQRWMTTLEEVIEKLRSLRPSP